MANHYSINVSSLTTNTSNTGAAWGEPNPNNFVGQTWTTIPTSVENIDWTFIDSHSNLGKVSELEGKVAELEKKLKAEKRKKITNIDIQSLQDFHFFMVTLLDKLKAHLGEEEKLHDNLEFLIDELVIELDKMLNGQSET